MLSLFRRLGDGSHIALPCVEYRQVRRLRLESESRDPLNIDGELTGATPVGIEMLAGAVQVFA
jgi:diacylglycerol kinase family enzyme